MSRYLSDEALEGKVREIRRKMGLEGQPKPDIMTVINKLKTIWRGFDYQRVRDEMLPDAEAQWDSTLGIMRIRESVFCAAQRGESRARMTVAHELGHFFLCHEGVRNRSLVKSASERFVAEVKREESEARRFAAVFLAPHYLVTPEDTAADISSRFSMSLEAAAIRREEVNSLERRAKGKLRELPSVVVDFLREAKRRGHAVTTRLD